MEGIGVSLKQDRSPDVARFPVSKAIQDLSGDHVSDFEMLSLIGKDIRSSVSGRSSQACENLVWRIQMSRDAKVHNDQIAFCRFSAKDLRKDVLVKQAPGTKNAIIEEHTKFSGLMSR